MYLSPSNDFTQLYILLLLDALYAYFPLVLLMDMHGLEFLTGNIATVGILPL